MRVFSSLSMDHNIFFAVKKHPFSFSFFFFEKKVTEKKKKQSKKKKENREKREREKGICSMINLRKRVKGVKEGGAPSSPAGNSPSKGGGRAPSEGMLDTDFKEFAKQKLMDPTISSADRLALLRSLAALQKEATAREQNAPVPLAEMQSVLSPQKGPASSNPLATSSPSRVDKADREPASASRSSPLTPRSSASSPGKTRSTATKKAPLSARKLRAAPANGPSALPIARVTPHSDFTFTAKMAQIVARQPSHLQNSAIMNRATRSPTALPVPLLRMQMAPSVSAAAFSGSQTARMSPAVLRKAEAAAQLQRVQNSFGDFLAKRAPSARPAPLRDHVHSPLELELASRIIDAIHKHREEAPISSENISSSPTSSSAVSSTSSTLTTSAILISQDGFDHGHSVKCSRVSAFGSPESREHLLEQFPGFSPDHPSGLHVFVIKQLRPLLLHPHKPADSTVTYSLGEFSAQECYLVLDHLPTGSALYLWVGSSASADKRVSAAFRTVQLSRLLGGVSQHREQQSEESPAFLQLLASSGVAFSVIDAPLTDPFVRRQLHPPPRSFPQVYSVTALPSPHHRLFSVQEVQCAALLPLQDGVAKIVDNGSQLLICLPAAFSPILRFFCRQLAAAVSHCDRSSASSVVEALSPGELSSHALLVSAVSSSSSLGTSSLGIPASTELRYSVFRLDRQGGSPVLLHDAPVPPSRSLLDPLQSFLVQHGATFYLWNPVLPHTPSENLPRPFSQPAFFAGVQLRGRETVFFRSLFSDWLPFTRSVSVQSSSSSSPSSSSSSQLVQSTDFSSVEPIAAHEELSVPIEQTTPDTLPQGPLVAYHFDAASASLTEMPAELLGHFWSQSCFVVVHCQDACFTVYLHEGREQRRSPWTRFLLTVKPVLVAQIRAMRGPRAQVHVVRVTEGLEPLRFSALFSGRLVHHLGSYGPGALDVLQKQPALYILKEYPSIGCCCAIQIPVQPSSDHDLRVLALFSDRRSFVNYGPFADVTAEDAAAELLKLLHGFHGCSELLVVQDNSSPFFQLLPPSPPLPVLVRPSGHLPAAPAPLSGPQLPSPHRPGHGPSLHRFLLHRHLSAGRLPA